MKNATLRLLTVVGSAVALSVVGIAPATAAPVAASAAVSVKTGVSIPTVRIGKIPNFNLTSTSARRNVGPVYTKTAGATPTAARLHIKTTAGKLIASSVTRMPLGVGSYRITTSVRYSYMQSGRKLYRTVSSTQTLAVGLTKPAPTVTILPIANSKATSATAVRVVRPLYKAGVGAKVISARFGVKSGSKVITPSATSVSLKPGSYVLNTSIRYTIVQSGKTYLKVVNRTQPLTISYTAPRPPAVTQPGVTFEQGVVNALNVYRSKAGMPALKTMSSLNAYNTRWMNSNFTSDEEPWSISPNLNSIGKIQSQVSAGFTPSSFAADMMNHGGKDLIYRPYIDHVSVVQKTVNGAQSVGVIFAGIS